ncbi:polysaccharide biosynthesis/export family protein [Sphingomonas arantia]|uniref:Polysaccharide biosynthesis/export family protein n=2 Tax=Sphingomonas arantia TaxID=1460676 RepID=A0ABW4U099_9SPHN
MPNSPFPRCGSVFSSIAMASVLAGCATLPSSGPTERQIRRGAEASSGLIKFAIVPLDAATVDRLRREETTRRTSVATLSQLAQEARTDTIGPGDVLTISIYEVGVALFGGAVTRVAGEGFDPSARSETFPTMVVDREGTIRLPYIGRLGVAGLTPFEVQRLIEQGLKGKSQSPQALVSIKTNIANTVYVSGDVRRPGRLELSLGRERLLDAIAASGGSVGTSEDTLIRFSRNGRIVEQRLGFIRSGTPDDLFLIPGDRVELIRRPRTFDVFGATAKVSQVNFETGEVSLAEALARVGGPNDVQADPAAVFLFRYDGIPDAPDAGPPQVYQLNMLKPESYFVAQRFAMRDRDVIYIANAAANQPAKLVNIINQLFSPLVTARAVTR